jgi:outer membrane receptor protein involved in Fe transport
MPDRRYLRALLAGLIACFYLSIGAAESDDSDEAADDEDSEESSRGDVEELIVTGSLIRRDNFDLPSPIDTIGELDLSLSGTPDVGDVIFDQTYQIGVNANTNTGEIGGADDQGSGEGWNQSVNRGDGPQGGETYANLRGVGTRATMTLMDGHRVPTNVSGYGSYTRRTGADLGNMYPNIAIARIDNILDGASAIYGAEAVSGVVNIIPRKNFEGLKIDMSYQIPMEDGEPYRKIGLLAGAQGDRTSVVFALEISDAESMAQTQRPDYIQASAGWTGQLLPTYGERGNGLPGDWRVPLRNSTGELYLPDQTNPYWYEANGQHSTALGKDIHEVYNNINMLNEDNIPSLLSKDGSLIPAPGAVPWSSSWRYPQYPRDFNDNTAAFRTLHLHDPGCNNDFGAGFNDYGTAPQLDAGGSGVYSYPEPYTTKILGQNSTTEVGNWLNGFLTGDWRGQETRSRGTETNQAFGSDCRTTWTDFTDIREERDQEQGMAYFEHEVNDYITIRGEAVFSRLKYKTRSAAPSIDEWPNGGRTYDHTQPIAIGSNPGNPYRAFADDSNVCDVLADSIAECASYVPGHVRDANDTAAAEAWGYVLTGPVLVSHGTLDYHDTDGDGRYDYLQEPGEWLVFAQDSNGDGLPDRDFNGDGIANEFELADRYGQTNPMHRVILLSATGDSDGDGVPDRFDPDMDGTDSDGDGVLDTFTSGGIRLFDDVLMGDSGVGIHGYIGAFPKQPYVHESYPWLNQDMSLDDKRLNENIRLRLGTTVMVPDTEWIVDADWIFNNSRREWVSLDPAWNLTNDSLRCQGGPNGNACWNPFSTAWLSQDPATGLVLPADAQGWRSKDDPAWNTSIETRNAGLSPRHVQRDIGMHMIDLTVSNSEVAELPFVDTPIGVAIGIHIREEKEEFRPDQLGAAGISSDRVDFQGSSESVNAYFAEVRLNPLESDTWGDIEIQAALRYTDYEIAANVANAGKSADFDVTIPKLAIRYQPTDWLAIRSSITEGFVPPGSYQLFNSAPGDITYGTQSDYICDAMPELAQCEGALGTSGGIANVATQQNSGNRGLEAEMSDLWNAGISLSLLGGDLVFDADYTNVVFNGRVERMGAGVILGQNSGPFEIYAAQQCPGTSLDYDNEEEGNVSVATFLETASSADLACRATAARTYITEREQGLGGATIVRDGNNRLTGVNEGWLNQGESKVRSIVYNMRYRFDADEIPFLNLDSDFGTFAARISATQMLEMSLMRYHPRSGHPFAGMRVDGLGNRNSAAFWRPYNALFSPLPPTPKLRVNGNLRWFRGNHTAQIGFRWHQEITDLIASWDEIVARYGPAHSEGNPYLSHDHGMHTANWVEADACTDQDRNPYCKVDSRAYWDVSYTYQQPDVLGFGYVAGNIAIRNIFESNPKAIPSGAGYESYLDSIMGRQLYLRLSVGF